MARVSASKMCASLALPLLLAGCATSPEPVWVKPGATTSEYHRDDSQCRREAGDTDARGGSGIAAGSRATLNQDLYFACMRGRGWTRRP